MKAILTILFFNYFVVNPQTIKLAPLYVSIPSYTQVQEDSVKLTYVAGVTGQYIWNTELLKTRIWNGLIFTNAPELPATALPLVSPTLPGAITQTDLNAKQNTITTGSTAQYFRGDLSLSTFPTTTAAFTNSTDKNFVSDAKLTVVNNTTGTNSGDNSANTIYANDYRAANFIAGTNYQSPLVSGTNIKTINGATILGSGDLVVSGAAAFSSITGQPTDNANLSTALNAKAPLASPSFTGTPTGIGIPVYARVTGSNATTTGQALTNITGLSASLIANATYEFEAVLSVSTSAVTTGTAYGVNYSVSGATIESSITGSSTSTAAKTLRISALNTATLIYLATSAQTGGIVIKGIVTTGANAGNFTVSHLKLSSGTSTVFINSYLKVVRIL